MIASPCSIVCFIASHIKISGIIAHPVNSTDPRCACMVQSESVETSSPRREICAQRPKPTGLLLGTQNPSIKHGGNMGNHFGILLPVCCRHAGIWSLTTGPPNGSYHPSSKYVPYTRNHSRMQSPAYDPVENKLCPVIPKVANFRRHPPPN